MNTHVNPLFTSILEAHRPAPTPRPSVTHVANQHADHEGSVIPK